MKPVMFVPLLLCTLLLAGCYRQAEEPFQQVDSAAVVDDVEPTPVTVIVEGGGDTPIDEADTEADEPVVFVTPEVAPGQVSQPIIVLPTETTAAESEPTAAVILLEAPTETPSFVEELDPNDECVYTVVSGDNLFQLSLRWNTTVQSIMTTNQLDSDALFIGELVLMPNCEPSPEATQPIIVQPPTVEVEQSEPPATAVAETGEQIVETPGPRIHIVSAGDTLESISLRYRADVNEIIRLNNLPDPDRLSVGQELLLPDP